MAAGCSIPWIPLIRAGRRTLATALAVVLSTLCLQAAGVDLHPTRRAQNFIAHDLRGGAGFSRFGSAPAATAWINLDLDVLAVSAERVQRAVYHVLNISKFGNSTVHLILNRRKTLRQTVEVIPLFEGGAWQYRVEVPDAVDPQTLLRGLVEVVLLEMANRGSVQKSAEIPVWLKEGLTFHLLNVVGPELIVSRVESGSMLRSIRNMIGADPLRRAREILPPGMQLSISDLGHPETNENVQREPERYRAACQFLVSELLRLPDGERLMVGMLRELPHYWNWESAFFRGFYPQFESLLDLEKWWAVKLVSFTGRNPNQAWGPTICLQQLDEILLASVQLRWSTNALPVRSQATLQQVLTEWEFPAQQELLWQVIRRLTALRPYCPRDIELRVGTVSRANEVEAYGRSLAVAAYFEGRWYVRIFDSNGNRVVDWNQEQLEPGREAEFAQLTGSLTEIAAGLPLSDARKLELLDRLSSLVGYTRPPPIQPLIDAYLGVLSRYLDRRASLMTAPVGKLLPPPSSQAVAARTVEELDALMLRREALWRQILGRSIAKG